MTQEPTDGLPRMRTRRVLKAYEQVAEQLRDGITSGELAPGQRLPNEVTLAREFGVSRATIREALRVLAAHSLVRTAKGTGGGTYVTLPTVDHISEFLSANIGLLTEARDVSLQEFLEARELLEVPAARLAARRRAEADVEELRRAIPPAPLELTTQEQFSFNKQFHSIVVQLSGNTLLVISTQPIFSVLQTNLARSALGQGFHRAVNEDHQRIADAIAAGDSERAGEEMSRHLQRLRGYYEKGWRHRHAPDGARGDGQLRGVGC